MCTKEGEEPCEAERVRRPARGSWVVVVKHWHRGEEGGVAEKQDACGPCCCDGEDAYPWEDDGAEEGSATEAARGGFSALSGLDSRTP